MRRIKLVIIFSFIYLFSTPQNQHKLLVFFRHGSKPYREYRRNARREVGGFYGGHVSMVVDSIDFGFTSGEKIYVFPRPRKSCGFFYVETLKDYQKDTVGMEYTTIRIPINDSQYIKLKSIIKNYLGDPPYCYAFLGMRCASAAYDVLSQIGIVKFKRKWCNIFSNFYPRLLRKKMKFLAKKEHYKVIFHKGKKTRIWENV